MGSQGWDITDDDVKKPSVLFLGPMKYAHQEMEDFQEYFVVKVPSLQHSFYHHRFIKAVLRCILNTNLCSVGSHTKTKKSHDGDRDDLIRKLKKGKYDGFAAIVWNSKNPTLVKQIALTSQDGKEWTGQSWENESYSSFCPLLK